MCRHVWKKSREEHKKIVTLTDRWRRNVHKLKFKSTFWSRARVPDRRDRELVATSLQIYNATTPRRSGTKRRKYIINQSCSSGMKAVINNKTNTSINPLKPKECDHVLDKTCESKQIQSSCRVASDFFKFFYKTYNLSHKQTSIEKVLGCVKVCDWSVQNDGEQFSPINRPCITGEEGGGQ